MMVRFALFFAENIISDNVGCKGDDRKPEARKEVPEHYAIGENRMFAPGLALGPWISE